MFRTILVTLDGSTFSEQSLPWAVEAAQQTGAALVLALVHVREAPVATDLGLRAAIDEWEATHADREKAYLGDVAERLRATHGLAVRSSLLHGEIVPALKEEAQRAGADLVVVTTHGRAGLERAWLGSVADALMRAVEVPMLVVRPHDDGVAHPARFRHVLVALDGSERAERAIAPALALSRDGRLTLLRVVAPPAAVTSPFLPHAVRISHEEMEQRTHAAERYLADIASRTSAGEASIETVIATDYHAAHALLAYARDNGVDVIAITTHARGAVARLVLGSVTDKVVRAADVPVLVC